MPISANQRRFIHEVLGRTGWSQTELAKRSGLDPSTLSRFLSNPRDGQTLRPSSIRRIEQVTGLAANGESPAPAPNSNGFGETEATLVESDPSSAAARILDVILSTTGNVDAWTLHSRALEMAGYRTGDILFVKLGQTPLRGDVVCAQIYDWSRNQAETVFRIYEPPFLVATTADSSKFRPYMLESEDVSVKGVVIHSLRSRFQFAGPEQNPA